MEIKMSTQTYDILKYIARYVLPALGTLYFAIATIWGLPYGEQIVGTISAIDIFLATILGISAYQYDKAGKDISGTLYIDELPNASIDSFVKFDESEEAISEKDTIKLRVQDGIYSAK